MLQLSIPIPNIPGQQDIDIDMTINGQKQTMHFRVEVYYWSECEVGMEHRIDCIRDLVKKYSDEWMIYNIGSPTDNYVPLTFVKTTDWEWQRKLMLQRIFDN